jgi:manganese/iron transport system permease protein
VLRSLAFYTHGVGAAAFPGLVVAGPLGIPSALSALGVAAVFAGALERARAARVAVDVATAILLVAALAIGIVLASDVFESGAKVDQLLFGSLLAIGGKELALTAGALALIVVVAAWGRRAWIAAAFDPQTSPSLGLPATWPDRVLLAAIAVAVVVSLDAIGALLVGAVLVVPAATARLFAASVIGLEAWAVAIALTEGVIGLWLAYELDAPPGSVIAVLAGGVFAAVAGMMAVRRRGARAAST